jgi:cytochrome d ubiquinol oxidase subunit I
MQTPQGYAIIGGRVVPTDWWQVIFNPSFPYRLVHMTIAAYLATALFVGAAGAWALLKGRVTQANRTMFSMAMWMALIVAPIQVVVGDAHGLNTLKYQPAKIAAIEGHWENTAGEKSVPLILLGWPDMQAETTRYALQLPYLGSLILTHSLEGRIPGLKEFPPQDRPKSTVVFWTFRLMVGLGMAMVLLGLCSALLRFRGRLYDQRLFLRATVAMGPAGLLAILAGWVTTEMGRQPWVVYGVMRTQDAVSNHSVQALTVTLLAFVIVYFAVFGVGITYMLKLIAVGPDEVDHQMSPDARPARPLSAAPDSIDPLPDGEG